MVLALSIDANDRDAWQDAASPSIEKCSFGDATWNDSGGYQWSLPVPLGATILDARMSVFSAGHGGAAAEYTVVIHVEDVDDATAFENVVDHILLRDYWGTVVSWTIPSTGLPVGNWSDSPPLSTLIQHVVDRSGWQSGNYVGLGIWGTTDAGGANEVIRDYHVDPTQAAVLNVTYVP